MQTRSCMTYLFLPVLQHVLELGELLVLIRFDAFGLVSEPAGVILLQALNGLLLLLFQVLHFLIILTLLSLHRQSQRTLASVWQMIGNISVYMWYNIIGFNLSALSFNVQNDACSETLEDYTLSCCRGKVSLCSPKIWVQGLACLIHDITTSSEPIIVEYAT